jgi:hypothetical protein
MAHFRGNWIASGGPGDEPRWTGALPKMESVLHTQWAVASGSPFTR